MMVTKMPIVTNNDVSGTNIHKRSHFAGNFSYSLEQFSFARIGRRAYWMLKKKQKYIAEVSIIRKNNVEMRWTMISGIIYNL
mmetsp:Transcript_29173/g.61957  ORF Transcript_29173/g.61957 Transcript_29173/m.61957 type:complete len:82 (-) Transcript_29173:26-271(-)